jgi:Arc/MetJ-type ribon-helix-helix transcriptional regulator
LIGAAACAIMPRMKDHLVQVKLAPPLVTMLDDLRRYDGSLPSRSDIIRRLIEDAHAAATKPTAPKPARRAS